MRGRGTVSDWLAQPGLERYAAVFAEHDYARRDRHSWVDVSIGSPFRRAAAASMVAMSPDGR